MPLRLLKGIRHFKNNQFKQNKEVYSALSKGQAPDVLFFGCIDSRIDHRAITNSQLGELLVARNPGNIIPPYSPNAPSGEASSSEFALEHLNVSEIIVCGHSHCGAMKGLMTPGVEKSLPNTAAWLNHAQAALAQLQHEHADLEDEPEERLKVLTQKNILLQIEHLKTHPAVAKRLSEGKVKIHGWYYEFEKGEIYIYDPLKKAFVSFEETVDEVAQDKLRQLVDEEAVNYLDNLTPRQHRNHYHIIKQYANLHPVATLWPKIQAKVALRVQQELGELYLTSKGKLNAQFNELLKKGVFVPVCANNNKYNKIETIFNQALNHKASTNKQKELLAAITQLKAHTLQQFALGDKNFSLSQCQTLAQGTKLLCDKLMKKEANLDDLEQFKKLSHAFHPSTSTIRLKLILSTIAALALGILSGFALGAVPGALAGGLSALLTVGLWAQQPKPLDRLNKITEEMMKTSQETDEPTLAMA